MKVFKLKISLLWILLLAEQCGNNNCRPETQKSTCSDMALRSKSEFLFDANE